ncbi:MAG: N-6 DNA methylase, partial [Candidatus Hodarchaeota archaeon]
MNYLLNQESKKDKGQFFTPKGLVKPIIKQLIPYIKSISNKKSIRILDPAIGKGIFFETLLEFINEIP